MHTPLGESTIEHSGILFSKHVSDCTVDYLTVMI